MNIIAVPCEHGMRQYVDVQIQVSRGAALLSRVSLPCQPEFLPGADSCRNLYSDFIDMAILLERQFLVRPKDRFFEGDAYVVLKIFTRLGLLIVILVSLGENIAEGIAAAAECVMPAPSSRLSERAVLSAHASETQVAEDLIDVEIAEDVFLAILLAELV